MAVGHQPLDDRAHLRNVLGGARFPGGTQAAQRIDIGVKLPLGLLGDPADRLVQRQVGEVARGARVDLVVDVGDVADIADMVRAVDVPQQAEQHVEHDHRASVADMGKVVDRGPADIHPHMGRIERPERLLVLRQGIVETEFHRSSIQKRRARRANGKAVPRAGRPLMIDEKRRPQPAKTLANNPAANATNGEEAGHGCHHAAAGGDRQGA